jgi:Domain of unknown function (DUF3883)
MDYIIKNVEKDNVGWDLEAKPEIDGVSLCLEVKGLFGSELKVGLTPNEYRILIKHREGNKAHYRLCVVTEALSYKSMLRIFRYEVSDNKWFDDVSGKPSALNIVQLEAAIISLASEN